MSEVNFPDAKEAFMDRRIIPAIINKFSRLYHLFIGDNPKQFRRYLITGFTSFSVEYLLYFLLYQQGGLGYLLANAIVYAFFFWLNFLMNRLWSFQSTGRLSRQLPLYAILFAFNLGATTLLLTFFSETIGISPLISKVLVMGAVVSWNFVIYKKVIYK